MAATSDMDRLTTFQHHIDDMRNLTMCKICLKPLYEPFTLACGHTYCYGCLRSWFSGLDSRRRKKNCPDCRAEVRFIPSPNYILRDLVHMFIGRAELLPEDETVEEHVAGKKSEAELMSQDKTEGGLFQGVFMKTTIHSLIAAAPIRDLEDGVERCPICAWEMEDGLCSHCGYDPEGEYDTWSEGDNEIDLTDGDQSIASDDVSEESYDSENSVPPHFYGAFSPADEVDHTSVATDVTLNSELGSIPSFHSDDDEDEDDMEGFIDDASDGDEPEEVDEDDMGEAPARYVSRPRSHLYRIPDDDEESSDGEEENVYNWHPGGHTGLMNDGESDGDDQHGQVNDSEEVHTNYDESDQESRSSTPIPIPTVQARRSVSTIQARRSGPSMPTRRSVPGMTARRSGPSMPTRRSVPGLTARRSAIVISDEEDESGEEENADHHEDEDEDEDEDEGHDHSEDQEDEEESHNDLGSHTEGRSQSGSADGEGNESDSSGSTARELREDMAILTNQNRLKRRRSPDTWRSIARPRRDDQAERQTPHYRTSNSRGRHARPIVSLSS